MPLWVAGSTRKRLLAKQCERCGSGVPDANEKCQVCGAPMAAPIEAQPTAAPAAPAPAAAPPSPTMTDAAARIPGLHTQPEATPSYSQPASTGSGDIRVSLTGDVMEVPAPSPRGTGPGGYGPPMGAPRAGGPAGAAPTRGRYGLPVQEAPAKSGAGAVIGIVLLVLFLAGAGAGGWWWYNNRTNPKEQAQKVADAMNQRDWKALFYLCAWSSSSRVGPGDADEFARASDTAFNQGLSSAPPQVQAAVNTLKMAVGEPKIDGSTADVPTTTTMTIGPVTVTFKGTAHMIRQSGIWKLDLTKGSPQDPGAWQKAGADLIGKPEGLPAGMGGFGMGGGGTR
jgi:hypothetical protein